MTEKSRDIHGNWRDIIIGVRVSECQYNKVMELINMEGINKREFIRKKLENSQIRCMKNRKAYMVLKPKKQLLIILLNLLKYSEFKNISLHFSLL